MRSGPDRRHYDEEDGKANLMRLKQNGESGWNEVNFVDREGEAKKEEIEDNIDLAAKKLGLRPDKFKKQLDAAKNNGEIYAIDDKLKSMGANFFKKELIKSNLWAPMQEEEARFIKMEFDEAMGNFQNMSLSEMIEEIDGLKSKLKERKKFRTKLSTKSTFVKKEYFRRVSISKNGPNLLKDIEEKLKPVLESPSAIQYEFSKLQKSKKKSVDTKKIAEELQSKFEKRTRKYNSILQANRDVFGGKEVNSKFGKVPLTLLEFSQWFEGRESFAEMDAAAKKLPGLIQERKRLYDKKDDILKHLPPKDKKRINKKVKLMRRHELQAYLPVLEKETQQNNIHTAEYFGKCISARTRGINLFPQMESRMMLQNFRRKSPEAQELYMKVLDEEIKDRDRTVREYLNLPPAFRDDFQFLHCHALDRARLLNEAQEKINRQKDNPFDIDTEGDIDAQDIREVEEDLDKFEGRKAVEEAMEDLKREGELQALNVRNVTQKRVQYNLEKGNRENKTQQEVYEDEIDKWTYQTDGVKTIDEARTGRQKAKVLFRESAAEAWDEGHVMTSGGEVMEKQEINLKEIEQGSKDVLRRVSKARYADHIHIKDKEGRDSFNMIDKLKTLEEQQMDHLADLIVQKLTRKQMGMSITKSARFMNSVSLHDKIRQQAANNEHFYNERAA